MFIVVLAFVARRRREIFAVLHFANSIFLKEIDNSKGKIPKNFRLRRKKKLTFELNPPLVPKTGITRGGFNSRGGV